jgi:hypothetical protein
MSIQINEASSILMENCKPSIHDLLLECKKRVEYKWIFLSRQEKDINVESKIHLNDKTWADPTDSKPNASIYNIQDLK